MAYISAKIGFDDPRSIYQHTTDDNDRHYIKGVYVFNEVFFNFSLNYQNKGNLMRGRITAKTADGEVIKKKGSDLQKEMEKWRENHPNEEMSGKALERRNIYQEFTINTFDDDAIKKRIADIAAKLFSEYNSSISADLKKFGITAQNTAVQAALIHKKAFMKSCYSKVTNGTRHKKEMIIDRVTAELNTAPMGKVTSAMLKHYARNHEKSWEEDLRTAEKFWEYCRNQGVYRGENPITAFLQDAAERKQKKSNAEAINKAKEFTCLPEEVERKLNDRIRENIGDSGFVGIALVKEGGLQAKEACNMRWKDVWFNDDTGSVSLHFEIEDNAGATHVYVCPLSPFGAEVLRAHRDRLLQCHFKEELDDLLVITPAYPGKKPVSSKELTQLCRTELLRAGMGEDNLLPINGKHTGVGVHLLHRNLKYRLEYHCGLVNDPAAVSYLLGHSLQYDVTADHYRSFTSPEGQRYLYNAIKRDKRFLDIEKTGKDFNCTTRQLPDGRVEWIFSPTRPDKILYGSFRLTLNTGEICEISAEQGLLLRVKTEGE